MTFRRKLKFALVTSYLLLLSLFLLYYLHIQKRNHQTIYKDSMSLMVSSTANSIAFPLKINDLRKIHNDITFLSNSLQDGFVEVIDANGQPVLKTSRNPTQTNCSHTFSQLISYSNRTVGEILACHNYPPFKITNTEKLFLASISLLFSIAFLILYIAIIREALPVISLSKDLKEFSIDKVNNDLFGAERGDGPVVKRIKFHLRKTIQQVHFHSKKIAELNKERDRLSLAKQVAHDIRSPLSALTMAVETSQSIEQSHRQLILDSSQSINQIAEDLLTKTRIRFSRKVTEKGDTITFYETFEQIEREKRMEMTKWPQFRVSVVNILPQEALLKQSTSIELKRLVSNLVNNSRQATENSGHVEVSAKIEGDSLSLSIADNGPGFAPQTLRQLQLGIPPESTSGNGLGLKHAIDLIHKWGGKINFENFDLENGAKISIFLPLSSLTISDNWSPFK